VSVTRTEQILQLFRGRKIRVTEVVFAAGVHSSTLLTIEQNGRVADERGDVAVGTAAE